eukprot:COSAG01_NODE_62151_length_286_cov_0.625668_1_plen_91_part_00
MRATGQNSDVFRRAADCYLMEPGAGSTTASCIVDQMFINFTTRVREQRPMLHMIESDCGPLQLNPNVVHFGGMLVAHEFTLFSLFVYHEQ